MIHMKRVLEIQKKLLNNRKEFEQAVENEDFDKQIILINELLKLSEDFEEITKRGN